MNDDDRTVLDACRRCGRASCREAARVPVDGTSGPKHPCCLAELLDEAAARPSEPYYGER